MAQGRKSAIGALINFMAEFYKTHVSLLFSKHFHGKIWKSYLLPVGLVPY